MDEVDIAFSGEWVACCMSKSILAIDSLYNWSHKALLETDWLKHPYTSRTEYVLSVCVLILIEVLYLLCS